MFCLFGSCISRNNYGYVYDADSQKPLSNVLVNDFLNGKKTKTDETGFFELPKGMISSKLIFLKKNYTVDTINSIEIQNGEFMKEKFKGEKVYLFNIKSNFRDSIRAHKD